MKALNHKEYKRIMALSKIQHNNSYRELLTNMPSNELQSQPEKYPTAEKVC